MTAEDKETPRRTEFLSRIGGISAVLAGTAAAIYVLGLFALWAPVARHFTGDFFTAWYAVSLIPRNVVAGEGVRQLLVGPLAYLLIAASFVLLASIAKTRLIPALRQIVGWARNSTPRSDKDVPSLSRVLVTLLLIPVALLVLLSATVFLVANTSSLPQPSIASSSGYQTIDDGSRHLTVDVPSRWQVYTGKDSEGQGSGNWSSFAGESVDSSITASPDLNAWANTGELPGIYIVASEELAQRYTDDQLITKGPNDYSSECGGGGVQNFNRSSYSGKIQAWNCDASGLLPRAHTIFTASAAPQGRGCVVVLQIFAYSNADREVAQHILDTFEADCRGTIDLSKAEDDKGRLPAGEPSEPSALSSAIRYVIGSLAAYATYFVTAFTVFIPALAGVPVGLTMARALYLPADRFLPKIGDRRTLLASVIGGLTVAFIAAFVLSALRAPPLPNVQMTGKEELQGVLLTHTDGLWYVFDQKGNLMAVPDDQAGVVQVSSPAAG